MYKRHVIVTLIRRVKNVTTNTNSVTENYVLFRESLHAAVDLNEYLSSTKQYP